MQHLFSQVPKTDIPRSKFNRSHGLKTTFDAGYLVPILVDEVLPGDTFNLKATLFTRVATLISPIMDNMYLDTFFFFVPERLVFENFQRMCGEQDNPEDSTDFIFPTITAPTGGFTVGSLADYFGLPTGVSNLEVRAEPFRAYNLIYNEWFRDENLQDSVPFTKADDDKETNYKLLRRGKRHDYFTSALPWPQKGPGVELPFGGIAPVVASQDFNVPIGSSLASVFNSSTFNSNSSFLSVTSIPDKAANNDNPVICLTGSEHNVFEKLYPLYTDLSNSTAVTINQFREAFQIQKWYERAARGGTRYTEILRSFFGVISPDARPNERKWANTCQT